MIPATIYKKAVQTWGISHQMNMASEECGELLSALNKFRRARVKKEAVIEEIADVMIMMEQLRIWFGPAEVDEAKRKKIVRLDERLQEKEVHNG